VDWPLSDGAARGYCLFDARIGVARRNGCPSWWSGRKSDPNRAPAFGRAKPPWACLCWDK
jgi:hypothetical protein